MYVLSEKQYSFLLQAGCDILPAPLNVARWNIIGSPVCTLCHSKTNHVASLHGDTLGIMTLFLQHNFRKDLPPCTSFMLIYIPGWQVLVLKCYTTSYYIYSKQTWSCASFQRFEFHALYFWSFLWLLMLGTTFWLQGTIKKIATVHYCLIFNRLDF